MILAFTFGSWFTPIPCTLTAIGVAIAILSFRRSRMQSLRISGMGVACEGRHPDWKYHEYFTVDLLCVGADTFDLEVWLECDHSYWSRGRRVDLVRKLQFLPTSPLPNPMRNGQVVRFELGDHDYRDLNERHYADTRAPSQLGPWRVRLAIYHSGHRLLFARRAWRFWRRLREFDSLARKPAMAKSLDGSRTNNTQKEEKE